MIHDENPFGPIGDDPTKRFRGRLAAPVTVFTAGDEQTRTGLTVSSLLIVEGEPATVYAVVTPNSDLYDQARTTGRFVVHICSSEDLGLADVFAGIRPSPGGVFANSEVIASPWGPVLADLGNRLFCTTLSVEDIGWSGLVVGQIDRVEVTDLHDPLIHFRGSYRGLR